MIRAMRCAVFLIVIPTLLALDVHRAAGAADPGSLQTVWIESLDLSKVSQEYGAPGRAKSVDGNPLRLGGQTYAHGLGTHASSLMTIDLKGSAVRFESMVGIDDERPHGGSAVFQVFVGRNKVADSGVMHGGDPPKRLSASLEGARRMSLVVTDAGDGNSNDHADWADALIAVIPQSPLPVAIGSPVEPAPPIASGTPHEPRIHGPRIVGTTPGHPFLFRIAATGDRPMRFGARALPQGIRLDPATGILSGSAAQPGATSVVLTARNRLGTARRRLRIVAGAHQLALTPPLGWNSWNVWAGAVDDAKVRAAADWLVKSGLADHGYEYINIDDTWEGPRDANGEITTNKKFPNMKALADYVHGKGLKLGIYSSPGPTTCGGYPASYQHELQDAQTYAKWGIDFLKYDWCSYGDKATGGGLERVQRPYRVMRQALDRVDRDIVYSLCQYGMGNVWEWGAQVGGNMWRTTGDINDSWGSMAGNGFSQAGHERFAGPGHWNDPDMLVVGRLGWGPNIHPTHLTQNEQITHITLWCLQANPLLLGCDLSQLDPWTIALMSNDDVLDVDQDTLGKAAHRTEQSGRTEVWSRPLADGTVAVGLFNRGEERAPVSATWASLGLTGTVPVRDLWQRKDLPPAGGSITLPVPAHGAVMLKIGRPRASD